MTDKDTPPGDTFTSSESLESLRQQAEAILSKRTADAPDLIKGKSPFLLKRTLHELNVHQIELEMQNEELRKAQAEVEAARHRYFDLYDLAPVGYVTLNEEGVILESNYAAAGLLGVSRRGLGKQPITKYVFSEDQDTYYLQCKRLLETGLPQVAELRMKGRDRKPFWVRLEATIARTSSGTHEFRIVLTNINERKQAEEALNDSLEFSSSLIRYMQDGLSVLDLEGVALGVNPALCEMTGFSEEDLVGDGPPHPYWPPEEYERIQKALEETLTGNGQREFELIFMRKDGVRFPVVVSPFAVKNRAGETIRYAATVKNITAWKQAERALQESEAFQKDILNSLPAHIAVLDQDGVIVEVNEPWLEFARANGNPAVDKIGVGANYVAVCHLASRECDPYADAAVAGLESVLSGRQKRFVMEYPCDAPDHGRWFSMEIMVPASSGCGAIVTHTDITERKRAEEALRDANQKLRLHFEQTPMAVIEWDLDFRVTNWNPAARTIFGFAREEALGQHASFIVPSSCRPLVDGIWQELMTKGGGERSTNANVQKDGTEILCEWYNTPLIDEHGTVAGVASVVMDITQRSQALQLLAWEKSALELIGSITPLHEVLDELIVSLEKQLPGAICSVLLLDEDGIHLRHGAAPSLPQAFNDAIDGLGIGPTHGSCGTSAYTKHQIIVEDIATDPLWTDFRELVEKYGLRACWSTPILDTDKQVMGTFAIYYREVRRPAAVELELIERAVHVVRIAIKRKYAAEALQENEQKYRTLFENAGDAILLLEGEHIIDCNLRTLEIFKCQTRDQIVGHQPYGLSPPFQPDRHHSQDSVVAKINEALDGTPQFFDWVHKRLDGTTFPAEVSLNRVELGGRMLLQAIIRDISERKRAEEEIRSLNAGLERRVEERTTELQAANALLRDFKAALDEHALVSITDAEGVITYANDKFCAISRYSLEELIGQNHRLVNSGHHPTSFFTDLWQTLINGGVWKGEMKNRAKDGTVYWVDTTIVPFLGSGGKPAQFVAIRTDITERKLAEEALRVSGERLRLATEVAAIGVWERDIKSQTLRWDSRMFEIYGMPANPEGLTLYQDWRERVLPEDLAEQEARLQHTIATCGRDQREFRIIRASDQAVRYLQAAEMVVVGADGQALRVVGINLDITERKRSEQEIRKLNADLEQRAAELISANKELEAFSYSVSHDLRAPLRAVDGFSRIVLEDYVGKLDEEGQRKLGVIRSESQRMGRLIDDLLAFSRLGRQPIEPVEIDMHAMARGVFDELAARDPGRKLRLDLHPLPPAFGSEALVRQVWVNLVSNAIKFTRERDPGEIEIGARPGENGEQIYYVKDNGAGFDMRHSNKLFGVFQRLHSQEEFSGTGVGLALVQRIVHRHGGSIWAESEVDHGAAFYFTLANQKS